MSLCSAAAKSMKSHQKLAGPTAPLSGARPGARSEQPLRRGGAGALPVCRPRRPGALEGLCRLRVRRQVHRGAAALAGRAGARCAGWGAGQPARQLGMCTWAPARSQPTCPRAPFFWALRSLHNWIISTAARIQGTAELAGDYSTGVQEGSAHERLRRSGFCGMHSQVGWAGRSRRGLLSLATPIGACTHPQRPRKPRSPWQHTGATRPASCYVRLGPPTLWARGVFGQETSSPVLMPLLHSHRRAPSPWTLASTTAWCSG